MTNTTTTNPPAPVIRYSLRQEDLVDGTSWVYDTESSCWMPGGSDYAIPFVDMTAAIRMRDSLLGSGRLHTIVVPVYVAVAR